VEGRNFWQSYYKGCDRPQDHWNSNDPSEPNDDPAQQPQIMLEFVVVLTHDTAAFDQQGAVFKAECSGGVNAQNYRLARCGSDADRCICLTE
jgi:hypothetical protein